jgi:putative nucleotidyltransferase with HDIG domain
MKPIFFKEVFGVLDHKKRIELRNAKPGMVLAAPVLSDVGRVIVNEGVTLTDAMLRNMDTWKVLSLSVWSDKELPKQFSAEYFVNEYAETVQIIDNAFASTRFAGELPLAEMKEVVIESVVNMVEMVGAVQLLHSIDRLEEYLLHHSVNVSVICGVLGKWLGYQGDALRDIILAGLLHDIGKTQIPQPMLNKPEKLSPDEQLIMNQHSDLAVMLLQKTGAISNDIIAAIAQHHERMDGSGYPNGLRGDAIHPYARILAVADLYDAVTSERPYQHKESPFTAARMIAGDMYDKLDTATSATFLEHLRDQFIGSQVQLSDGRLAEVIMIGGDYTFQPVVKTEDGKFVDIGRAPNLKISQLAGS